MDEREAVTRAARLLEAARRVVVLTGAGISTESGIPDFRSPGGLWSKYNPAKLTYDLFCASEETRRAYWQIASESYPVLRDARPNAAHQAVVRIEQAGKLSRLVTQNVDGLHLKAGNSAEATIEIHGSALSAYCIECGAEHDRQEVHDRVQGGQAVPLCTACGGPLKPATISFGQAMPERETREAFEAAGTCDLMIVIGSSLVVYPAAALPDEAVRAGAELVIVNREATDKDPLASAVVRGAAGESMSLITRQAGLEAGGPAGPEAGEAV